MPFENYTELPHIAPRPIWVAARVLVFLGTIALTAWLATGSKLALTVAWSLCIPVLPALWLVAPGIWRNVCPMAFVNQLPRELGFTRGKSRPELLRTWAYPISLLLLFVGIGARLFVLNVSAFATAALFATALLLAFFGGLIFKGKSGWCGTFCPLAPVQKLYGQLPAVVVRNEYCAPCVGCQTHCYDFNPTAKLPSDLYDRDQWSAEHRRFFAGVYPGFVLGYFMFAHVGLLGALGFPMLSLGIFETIRAFSRQSTYVLVVLWGMAAFTIYYTFAVPVFLHGLTVAFGLTVLPAVAPALEGLALVGALVAVGFSVHNEALYRRAHDEAEIAKVDDGGAALRAELGAAGLPEVSERSSGKHFVVEGRHTLLEGIEAAGLHIETGCRMGMCGADPVLIVDGFDHLVPAGTEERSTLQRLGVGGNCRLACSAHVSGPVSIDIDSKAVAAEGQADAPTVVEHHDEPSIRVVIIGNGAAGMSAAEHLRRRDPKAKITVISEEGFHFYNRIGIGRLVHGRSAMQGLSLLEESWFEEQRIDVWLNTRVSTIDREAKTITLATGETESYDVLVLATGASAWQPKVPGIALDGSFVLRSAEDAMRLRHWSQAHDAKRAIVIGGGVLGIEAADALRQFGLDTTIIQRFDKLMERQLDDEAATILRKSLELLGISVHLSVEVKEIRGVERIESVLLTDGTEIPCDIVLTCAGVTPNAELARAAGLEVRRGIVVDDAMRTSDPAIFAVGDVAEIPGAIGGLWPVGKKQGEIAAATIVGEEARYVETRTMMHVKLGNIEVKCYGDLASAGDDHVHLTGSSGAPEQSWRRVVVKDGKIVAGVFIEEGAVAKHIANALMADADLTPILQRLQAGDWEALADMNAAVKA